MRLVFISVVALVMMALQTVATGARRRSPRLLAAEVNCHLNGGTGAFGTALSGSQVIFHVGNLDVFNANCTTAAVGFPMFATVLSQMYVLPCYTACVP